MKVRSQRTHFMGTSNRNHDNFDTNIKTQSIFERSFNKSKSLHQQHNADISSQVLQLNSHSKLNGIGSNLSNNGAIDNNEGRVKPFLGMHHEYESTRFNKMNKRGYKQSKMVLAPTQKILDLATDLNKQIKDIQSQFSNKDNSKEVNINMHKLRQLKHTFVKNNRDRRNMKPYYQKFINQSTGAIDQTGIRKLVKQYGFDVNPDQIRLICRLSTRNNNKDRSLNKNQLNISDFIQLMTREDVYYKTLQLGDGKDFILGQKTKHFPDKIHEILRNKFPKLKEAFKIYKKREQDIDHQKFKYVMKKLDLSDLVISQDQKNKIFNDYSENGVFNVQGLVCDIAEQQYGKKIKRPTAIDFTNNINVDQEKNYKLMKKTRACSLKNMSALDYQNHLKKAQSVLTQFKELLKDKKNDNDKKQKLEEIFSDKNVTRKEASDKIQNVLKKNGINFQKADYDAFLAYLDFDIRGQISCERIYKNIFQESTKDAEQRFERRLRNEAPKNNGIQSQMLSYSDEKTALQCLEKIKNHKMNPQNRELFNYLDADGDGYISTKQLQQKLQSMSLMENWQINTLTNYLDSENKGSIDFSSFNKKVSRQNRKNQNQLPFVRTLNSKSCSQWNNSMISTKRSFIKTMNQPSYQKPTQFSAWPQRLRNSDLSLIQPYSDSALYVSQTDRFRQKKQQYGLRQKMITNKIRQNRINKLANWNQKLQQNIEQKYYIEEERQAARNYAIRLTQQKYEQNCHKSTYG